MSFIIMQPTIDKVSVEAVRNLRGTGDNKFDCSLEGSRIRPILFRSRKYTETESHYQCFIGEVSTGN